MADSNCDIEHYAANSGVDGHMTDMRVASRGIRERLCLGGSELPRRGGTRRRLQQCGDDDQEASRASVAERNRR